MVKKVTFASNVKTHDGVNFSLRSVVFYQIVCGYFSNKFMDYRQLPIHNTEDVLIAASYNTEILTYVVNRLKHFRKLLYQKRLELLKEPFSFVDNILKIEDHYWDNDFFRTKVKKSGHKVSIVRSGSRDFNMSFEEQHIPHMTKLINLCELALEENKTAFQKWYIIEDYIKV